MSLGLYIHIPFCRSKCSYCDFFSLPGTDEEMREEYVRAVSEEIAARGGGEEADTVFFGGGTPTLLSSGQIERIVRAIRGSFRLAGDAEISMEGNPESVSEDALRGYRTAGVNRVSLGLQSLDDRLLRNLGRVHSAADARTAVTAARRAGFDNVGIDLMFGLPGQSREDWERDLGEALGMPVEHLALYELAVEGGTAFGRRPPRLPEEEVVIGQWETALEETSRAGYRHYEISNYARPERECRHNMKYWRDEEYVGFGAGGWGSRDGVRRGNPRDLKAYLAGRAAGFPPGEIDDVSRRTRMADTLVLNLRLLERGCVEAEFAARYGAPAWDAFGEALEPHLAAGRIERAGGRIRLTRAGLLLANDVWSDITGAA